jgi:NADH-quinone oxidoreductase subunit N
MEKLLQTDWRLLATVSLPILIPFVSGLAFVTAAPFSRKRLSRLWVPLSLLAVAVSFGSAWREWLFGTTIGAGMLLFDRMAYSFDLVFLIAALLTIFLSKNFLSQEKIREGEYYALLLFAVAGSMLVAHGGDLIVIFLGIEIVSLANYILAGMKRGAVRSYEAALKYFILGSFASGFLLYGIAMAYGATGSTSLAAFQGLTLPLAEPTLLLLAVALLLIGIGFKIAAVPFHLWSPDVYEGAPTSITAFMASVVKVAGFAALVRIAIALGHIPEIPWTSILWALSALTMTVGNLAALRQTNIKRMLAYSSIAHAGYALVGITAALQKNALTESTIAAVLFYLFAYSLMTIGAFAVVIALGRRGDEAEEMSDLSGLAERHPLLAAAMAVFMFSLTGIPPTIGFVGKFYLFSGAIEAELYGLVVVGVLNSVVSAYYYLGPIIKMYFQKERGFALPPLSYSLVAGIFVCLFAVLYLGIFPSELFLLARESVREVVMP